MIKNNINFNWLLVYELSDRLSVQNFIKYKYEKLITRTKYSVEQIIRMLR